MRRLHLIEIEDQRWCPKSVRDGLTDSLQFTLNLGNHYGCISGRLKQAMERVGTRRIVDLCSGGGGPWLRMLRVFEEDEHYPVNVCLTDWYPNWLAMQRAQSRARGHIEIYSSPVDARAMPAELKGFRTLFSSFHHFRPAQARAILEDAVKNRQGIGIFEFTQRAPLAVGLTLLAPLAILLMTPFLLPFRGSRLFWTYLVPLMPLLALFDGLVSCLRTYSPAELQEMVTSLNAADYVWEIGETRGNSPIPITFLIGYPA